MDDLLADFVAETREMLEASEGEIIAWEADPSDRARLDTIFRFVHTVKGNCGFFDFPRLADLSHAAEDALADVRAGRRDADSALVNAVLAIIDRIVEMVDAIEAGEEYPEGGDSELIAALAVDDFNAGMSAVEEIAPAEETAPEPRPAHEPASALLENGKSDAPAPKKPETTTQALRSIRLPVDLLDRVMSGVSDMVLARNDLAHRLRTAGNQPTIDGPFERLTSILSDVRDAITRMRMQRIETVFSGLPRLVRDLSAELGKQVMIDLEGGDVELDREMIEMVRDPLTHIIRNAIDHGMETPADRLAVGKREIGLLSIAARQSGNTISIVVSDDGRGLDETKIADKAVACGLLSNKDRNKATREQILELIFEPGFSTADAVSNVSGRGVGLDVVRDNLERVGGTIKVSSTPGVGTLFTLQIPLTLSIIAGLTVEVSNQRFAVPQSYVEEIVLSSAKSLNYAKIGETSLVTFRGKRTPCLMLGKVLGLSDDDLTSREHTLVLLRLASGNLFALAVDGIHSHGDLVVKPLAPAVMKNGCYAGSTLLDDGQPVLLLDVTNIAAQYEFASDTRNRFVADEEDEANASKGDAARVMLFTDYEGRRSAVRLELVRRIETISVDAIEENGRSTRAVIDGAILPLIGLPSGALPADRVRLLRLSDSDSELLMAVREIDDAAEMTEQLKPVSDDPLIEAVTLIEGRQVSLFDGHELFARYGEPPELLERPLCRLPDSDWARTILGPLVESAGYRVVGAENTSEDAISIVFEDIYEVAQALDDPIKGPVIRLRDHPDAPSHENTIYRYDRDALVSALRRARSGGRG